MIHPLELVSEANRTRYVCSRLEVWSEYLIQNIERGNGWPSQVPYLSMMAQNTGYRSVTLMPVTHDEFCDIDALVHRLPELLREVVVAEWLWQGHQDAKAKRCNIHRETYRNRLKWAYNELLKLGI